MSETTKLAEEIARDLLNQVIRPMHERGRALEIDVADMRGVIEKHLSGDPKGPITVLNDSSATDFMTEAARRAC